MTVRSFLDGAERPFVSRLSTVQKEPVTEIKIPHFTLTFRKTRYCVVMIIVHYRLVSYSM